ncbi:MAG: hypothetical protein IKY98_03655 [Alphaproteobacteria bacterium]|nr:hypothetical protein [Alphaproteobacteria bacterium]
MKKILTLTCFTLTIFTTITTMAASCAGGHGTTLTGINGTEYCVSKITMNWWSAFSWCDKTNGYTQLVSIHEDCDCTGYDGCNSEELNCPNLEHLSNKSWTSTPWLTDRAYRVKAGVIYQEGPSYEKFQSYRALCKKP